MKNKLAEKIANILPSRVVYWVIIRAFAYTTTHECQHKSPDEVGFSDIAKSWENKIKLNGRKYQDYPVDPKKYCSHENNSCLDGASGLHCREWEDNYSPKEEETESQRNIRLGGSVEANKPFTPSKPWNPCGEECEKTHLKPVLHDGFKCVCGVPEIKNVIHSKDTPCYYDFTQDVAKCKFNCFQKKDKNSTELSRACDPECDCLCHEVFSEKENEQDEIQEDTTSMEEKLERLEECEYDSFWDCHYTKAHCKKHFRI